MQITAIEHLEMKIEQLKQVIALVSHQDEFISFLEFE
jgi:hypothetical protein